MKKLLLMVLVVLSFVVIPKSVFAKNDVNIYIFRGKTCSHCEEALTYLNKHQEDIPEGVTVVTYEVWENKNNQKLEEAVASRLNIDTNSDNFGVPFIVIGTDYMNGYNGVVTFNKMISLAEKYQNEETYEDIVKEEADKLDVKLQSKTLQELYAGPSKTVTIVVYVIFGVIVLGFLGLIIFSRK